MFRTKLFGNTSWTKVSFSSYATIFCGDMARTKGFILRTLLMITQKYCFMNDHKRYRYSENTDTGARLIQDRNYYSTTHISMSDIRTL